MKGSLRSLIELPRSSGLHCSLTQKVSTESHKVEEVSIDLEDSISNCTRECRAGLSHWWHEFLREIYVSWCLDILLVGQSSKRISSFKGSGCLLSGQQILSNWHLSFHQVSFWTALIGEYLNKTANHCSFKLKIYMFQKRNLSFKKGSCQSCWYVGTWWVVVCQHNLKQKLSECQKIVYVQLTFQIWNLAWVCLQLVLTEASSCD